MISILTPDHPVCRRQGTKAVKQRPVYCGHVATRDEHVPRQAVSFRFLQTWRF